MSNHVVCFIHNREMKIVLEGSENGDLAFAVLPCAECLETGGWLCLQCETTNLNTETVCLECGQKKPKEDK